MVDEDRVRGEHPSDPAEGSRAQGEEDEAEVRERQRRRKDDDEPAEHDPGADEPDSG